MIPALPGHGNTAHSAAQPLRLWYGRLRLAYDSGNTYDRVMVELENGFELSVNGNQMICAYRR